MIDILVLTHVNTFLPVLLLLHCPFKQLRCTFISQSIASEVSGKMSARESTNKHQNRPGVCGLYLHFFLSIFALLECVIRLVIHLVMILIVGLTYYIVYCVSCGEWNVYSSIILAHHSAMYGLYSGLLCGIASNLCCPWNPPVCGYHIKGNTLSRPNVQHSDWNSKAVRDVSGCCCCCSGGADLFSLPQYKVLQSFFFAFGCFRACGSLMMCCATPGMCCNPEAGAIPQQDVERGRAPLSTGYLNFIQKLLREVEQETAEDTRMFYQSEYQCSNFDELISRRLGVGIPQHVQGQAMPARQQNPSASNPQYNQQQQQQPPVVYAAAVSSNGQPIVQGYTKQ